MPSVDGQLAAWLKSKALYANSLSGGVSWGTDKAVDVEFISPLDGRVDAVTEGGRHTAILAGPNVKDRALVKGRRRDLLFKCITLTNSRLGYSGAGKKVFVIGVNENDNNTTTLTVIRKLP
jgi:hypothetical protein